MKICSISNLYPPFIMGGAEISVKRIAEGLIKRGHEVIVITSSPDGKDSLEEVEGVKVYRVNPFNLYPLYNHQNQPTYIKPFWHLIDLWNPHSYITVKNILKKEKPDIVHVHNFKGFSLSVFSAIKDLDLPLIFTARDYSLICMKANLLKDSGEICKNPSKPCLAYNKIQKFLVNNKPDILIASSQFVIDKLKSNDLFRNVKTIKIPNVIQLDDEINVKDYDVIDILYIGTLSKHKGVQILIKAFKSLKYQNIKLHIVGKGKDEDEFKELAKSDDRIIFHGFLVGKDLSDFYKKSNITVVPSIWDEPFGNIIIESFKYGTPVIGSKIGGIPELIEEGYNGSLIEAGKVNELKMILTNLIEDPSKLRRLEKGALESVKKYDIKSHTEKLEKLYEGLLAP